MNTDSVNSALGWYLDDVRLYTCSRAPVPRTAPRIVGAPQVGTMLTAKPGRWSPSRAKTHVRWYADGKRIRGATGRSYRVRGADAGKRITIKVSARADGRHASTFSPSTDVVTT
jgi:hypothetical protein